MKSYPSCVGIILPQLLPLEFPTRRPLVSTQSSDSWQRPSRTLRRPILRNSEVPGRHPGLPPFFGGKIWSQKKHLFVQATFHSLTSHLQTPTRYLGGFFGMSRDWSRCRTFPPAWRFGDLHHRRWNGNSIMASGSIWKKGLGEVYTLEKIQEWLVVEKFAHGIQSIGNTSVTQSMVDVQKKNRHVRYLGR